MNMLEYAKTILKKVSFDKEIFKREYKKFVTMLSDKESEKLIEWQQSNFRDTINGNNLKTKGNKDEEV
ncbi:hypothetical protein FAZ15_14435 [Sphingobacterium olei]|uniref:Uncharacterized protein n=1 Tax=Sphingobacterium olei TaxID=2571155 RepID=A0A4U0NYW6_9SPHI|nr:hypothetical protein [Sphingobacterium olei]TJZ60077.1 hypothetical protein FAZ15_14435 [Sphingobacterium olei]